MLPYHEPHQRETDDELSSSSNAHKDSLSKLSDSEKLHQAFQNVHFHQITKSPVQC